MWFFKVEFMLGPIVVIVRPDTNKTAYITVTRYCLQNGLQKTASLCICLKSKLPTFRINTQLSLHREGSLLPLQKSTS